MAKNNKKNYRVGFDLGGTKMLAVVFDDKLRVVARNKKRTRPEKGKRGGLERIVETVSDALAGADVSPEELQTIGVGSPGPLDLDRGVLLHTPNLGWTNAPLKKTLESAFGCHATVINDVDAGVYGEYVRGAARDAHCVVGVFPGTGIGGGCVYDGTILRGKTLSCMEIGHTAVLPSGPLCGCGRRGCLESVASRLAISSAVAAAAFRGEAPTIMELAGTDLANIRSGVLAQAVAAGDGVVEEIIRNAARWLGQAVGNAVNLLAPDVVVLGGGLVEAMPELFQEEIERTARENVMQAFRKSFRVVTAQLGDDAVAIGAAAWAAERPGTES